MSNTKKMPSLNIERDRISMLLGKKENTQYAILSHVRKVKRLILLIQTYSIYGRDSLEPLFTCC